MLNSLKPFKGKYIPLNIKLVSINTDYDLVKKIFKMISIANKYKKHQVLELHILRYNLVLDYKHLL